MTVAQAFALSASVTAEAAPSAALQSAFKQLCPNGARGYSPDFFLATLSPKSWRPRIAVVHEGEECTGLVYSKERTFHGFNTGLIYADSTLGSLVVAAPAQQRAVLHTGIAALLKHPGIRGLRLLVPPAGYEIPVLEELAAETGWEMECRSAENHVVLPLQSTYEEFLQTLGYKTRRNFRYFRKKSQTADHVFSASLTLQEFEAGARALLSEDIVGGDRHGLLRALSVFKNSERPLLMGLRAADGEWLSLLGGWYEADRVVILLQMNSDRKHAKFSLSQVMRTHAIETLIQQEQTGIVWWAGVGEPLNRYTQPVPTCWVYLDKPSLGWRGLRQLVKRHRGLFKGRASEMTEWLVPSAKT
jgi:hypothetical protein